MEISMVKKVEVKSDYRFERKFIINKNYADSINNWLFNHNLLFKEIYETRIINNIYLDTINLDFYSQNSDGIGSRNKCRLRWYGNLLQDTNPTLEIKIKEGLIGYKKSFLTSTIFTEKLFDPIFLKNFLSESLTNKDLKEKIKPLVPSLINSYQRKYFESDDKKYRITIDKKINYFKPVYNFVCKKFFYKVEDQNIILELKYNKKYDDRDNSMFNNIPFRLDKNSKYVNGIKSVRF